MSSRSQAGVVPFEQARAIVEQYCERVTRSSLEIAPLLSASGRVLTEAILADRDFPPFPRATRDGYALRAQDVIIAPATLRITGQVKAGSSFPGTVGSGEAVEIMTGAAVPQGADAVVMVEYTSRSGDQVTVQRISARGENIVPAGSEANVGEED